MLSPFKDPLILELLGKAKQAGEKAVVEELFMMAYNAYVKMEEQHILDAEQWQLHRYADAREHKGQMKAYRDMGIHLIDRALMRVVVLPIVRQDVSQVLRAAASTAVIEARAKGASKKLT